MITNTRFPPIDAVRDTLRECGITGRQIYDDTGMGQSWQQAVKDGRSQEPSYQKVVLLVEYFEAHVPDLFAQKIALYTDNQEQ